MAAVGYSGTPLWKKLGIREGSHVRLIGAPPDFPSPLEGAPQFDIADTGEADVVVLFSTSRETLVGLLDDAIQGLAERGGLWIAWPKRASKVPTDITEDTLREIILPMGLVDNKVCAVTEVWSGLRFVRRLKK